MRFHVRSSALASLLFMTACAVPVDDGEEVAERHVHASHLEIPELPKLPSSRLTYVPHGNFAFATEAARMDQNGEPIAGTPRLLADRKITQKILLLGATGTEPAYLAAKAALDRIGVPYRALIASGPNEELLTNLTMTDNISVCNYSGVVIGTSGLGIASSSFPSGWGSAFTAPEWQALADFENACSARELVWYAYPGAEFGLEPVGGFVTDSGVDGHLTPAGQSLFVRVKDAAAIPYRYAYGLPAKIPATAAAATTALVTDPSGGVLVASHVGVDGRETLVSTIDANPNLTHSVLLEYDFVRWVTRGMFVGSKRSYLSAQIDDLFLDNNMWVVGSGNADNETSTFRLTGTDITSFVAWQSARKASLPAGSTFNTDLAFNGFGLDTTIYPDTTLLKASRAAGNKLTWLNHTWDHENLDGVSRAKAKNEVAKNCSKASNLGLNGFNCNELVTPDMSGLRTSASVLGMLDAGVKFVVSDTSITNDLRPGFPGTNPSFNVGRNNPLDARLYQIPRHPTSIFYDTSTPATETDEYNHIYRSYYGTDLTYAQILDKDSEFGLSYLLTGDIDPLMFHQANLRNYGGGRSLYADWIDAVVAKYLAFTDAPILTLRQNAIGAAMQSRGKLDACGLTVTMVESAGTRSLKLTATNACTVPLTGVVAPANGLVETYAGDPTTFVTMLAGQTKIVPLL